ncbi:MAG: efflux RND transporter permease subunit [Burkholderia contaminans]|uniref:MMPL family transporter n=4 Tax=Bacteria TaxID=2 RepID=A0AAP4VGA2_9BURK|nr:MULTISPECIES: MMPL family transporter [Burkholderia]MBH9669267.1 MMPL family transporter [Burkholderia contaminans]MBH9676251.1 MMPL family transporter [Burkholderia contaminans]MBH9706675.1 MMPL family transporter [Burkholderia contaminans]MBM6425799.1 MMPL family transporter [Burkholderia contaminans]MCA7878005.1 MMPL family transporter [Burkholderia contaminans]
MNQPPVSDAARPGKLLGMLHSLENTLFGHRRLVLGLLVLFTVVMACFAVKLRMDAGFEKQLPLGHEYTQTFNEYRGDLLGANRLIVVVKARKGSIWTPAALKRLYEVTQAVTFLPNVSRSSVQSLWTPNSFVNEITEDGFRADPLIPGTVTPDQLDGNTVGAISRSTAQGGFVGSLVSRDQSSAMVTADLNELDAKGERVDYVAFDKALESQLRAKFEDSNYEIQIIGFAKQIGDIANGASSVLKFCAIALLLTALAVYWYCRSVRLTILPLTCSLVSLVWQFGTLHLLGYGLDPLGVLVPFLVFAIGVSHGVQQINFIVREISHGKSVEQAARSSFSGLLIPGTLALVTAFVSFVTLILIPIPMVRELAITASLGVAYKIVTNLVMLPLAASLLKVDGNYAKNAEGHAVRRGRVLRVLAKVAIPRNAAIVLLAAVVVFAVAAWESRDRVVGTLQAGAPELRADARFNKDSVSIASSYDVGLDWISIVFEAPPQSCNNVEVGAYQDRFVWSMRAVPGVLSVVSFSSLLRQYNEGYNEGNPKMSAIPIAPDNYSSLAGEVARTPGVMRKDCSMTAVNIYLADHKATTITQVINAAKHFRDTNKLPGVKIRLASGNAGVLAAVNDEIERSELPMMLYVYTTIVLLVLVTYRDLRAVLACCLPLTIGTFIGYWFMKELQIGLTVATLPVMVLAVGIGVDYAFYIYNRLQLHLANGVGIVKALEQSILEIGTATIFTAITLAIGVATWSFSELKFQADMGKLLAFMFIVNMVMAMTVLPAFAVWLERIFPRRKPARAPGLLAH